MNKNELKLNTSGDIGSAKISPECDIKFKKSFKSSYGLIHLLNFAKASILSDNVILTFVEDRPLELLFQIDENSSLLYYLAPKLDD